MHSFSTLVIQKKLSILDHILDKRILENSTHHMKAYNISNLFQVYIL